MRDDAFAFGPSGAATRLISLPSARQYPMMAYDSRRKRTVIVGGDNGQAGTGESVLEYDSAQPNLGWPPGLPFPSGYGRAGGAMVFDEARGVMVLMGGAGAGAPNGSDGGRYSDTWELTPIPLDATILTPSTTVCEGVPITLTLATSDLRHLNYQWSRGFATSPIEGATNAILKVSDNDSAGTTRYTVSMRDDCGNVFTRFIDITTYAKPVPTASLVVGETIQCPGGDVQFKVNYFAYPSATLQWYRDNTLLAGQTLDTLSIVKSRKEDSGHYHLVLSNSCGTNDTLGLFDFTLQVGPAITRQPAPVTANPCDGADFTVAAIGVGALQYQWRMDGEPLTEGAPFTGATSTNLHIEPLVYSMERTFDVVVTDECGPANAVTSDPANLILPTPPWVEVEMKPNPPEQENKRGNWVSAFDENRGVLVMYGGVTSRGYRANSLWEYDGYVWTAIQDAYTGFVTTNGQNLLFDNTTAPSAYAAVYNPDDHLTYLIGDYSRATPLTVWTWNGANWRRPYSGPVNGGEQYYRAIYDRLNHKILLTRTHNGGYSSELLVYDPASNILSPPQVMQPPVDLGVFKAFWAYDEYRRLAFWYQNDGVGFRPASMWALDASMKWIKLPDPAAVPDYAFYNVTYDPVRRHAVEFGSAGSFPFDTSTRIFPGSRRAGLPSASDWLQILPDGPPGDPAGFGISPTNAFFPETIAFDRRRRALIAPGYVGAISADNTPPFPAWTTYESRYKDVVTFDRLPGFTRPSVGGTVSLKANAVGFGNLTYQWRHNATAVTNGVAGAGANGGLVSGAASATLTIANMTPSDFGNYDVVVSNKCGPMTSASVQLLPSGALLILGSSLVEGKFSISFATDPGLIFTIESAASPQGPWSKAANIEVPPSGKATYGNGVLTGARQFFRLIYPAY